MPVLASLAWDPANANVLAVGASPGRRFDSSPLLRSTRAAINASRELMAENRQRLAPPATDLTSTLFGLRRPAESGAGIRGRA